MKLVFERVSTIYIYIYIYYIYYIYIHQAVLCVYFNIHQAYINVHSFQIVPEVTHTSPFAIVCVQHIPIGDCAVVPLMKHKLK